MLDRIVATEAICVHVRPPRGLRLQSHGRGLITASRRLIYRHGLAEAAAGLGQPHCFVFSDEPAWVRANLKLALPFTLVDVHGPEEPHEDLRLMAACMHFVIANSSLSWWGAWLGKQPAKRVIAPQRRFLQPGLDTRDLIPEGWVRL